MLRAALIGALLMVAARNLSFADNKPAPDSQRIGQLIALLGSKDFQERERAMQQLISIGQPAVCALKDALKHPDPEVARRAAKCLEEIPTEITITNAIASLQDRSAQVRARATLMLAQLGFRAQAAVPALIKALDDEDRRVRIGAVGAQTEPRGYAICTSNVSLSRKQRSSST